MNPKVSALLSGTDKLLLIVLNDDCASNPENVKDPFTCSKKSGFKIFLKPPESVRVEEVSDGRDQGTSVPFRAQNETVEIDVNEIDICRALILDVSSK